MQISGATVLLTGATGGIGRAIAKTVASRGGRLIVTGRRGDELDRLVAECGGRAMVVDLAVREEVARLARDAGEVDILIANAGLPATGTLDSFTEGEIDRAIDVNLRAPMILAKELAPAMVARGRGHLLFMSSIIGRMAQVDASVYCATKFGLRGFAGALRADLHGTGVGVSVVLPGTISDAGMIADTNVELPTGLKTNTSDDVSQAVIAAIERGRGEVVVAPLSVRLLSHVGSVAPGFIAAAGRRVGAHDIIRKIGEGQRSKR